MSHKIALDAQVAQQYLHSNCFISENFVDAWLLFDSDNNIPHCMSYYIFHFSNLNSNLFQNYFELVYNKFKVDLR